MESNDHKFLYLCVCKFCKRKLRGNVCLDTRTVISTAHASGTSAQEIWDLCHSTSWPTSSNSRSCSCVYTTKNRIQVTMLLSRLPRNRQFIKVEYFFFFCWLLSSSFFSSTYYFLLTIFPNSCWNLIKWNPSLLN